MHLCDRNTQHRNIRLSDILGSVQEPKMLGLYWKYLIYKKIFLSVLLLLQSSKEIKDTLKFVTKLHQYCFLRLDTTLNKS